MSKTRRTCRSDSPTTSSAYQRAAASAANTTIAVIDSPTSLLRGRVTVVASQEVRVGERAPQRAPIVGAGVGDLARHLVGQLDLDFHDVDDALVRHERHAQQHVGAAL